MIFVGDSPEHDIIGAKSAGMRTAQITDGNMTPPLQSSEVRAAPDYHISSLSELIKITDNKFPFHVNLNKVTEESYHVGINCSYKNKPLSIKADHQNLYKALAKGIDSIKIQVIRKAEKVRN